LGFEPFMISLDFGKFGFVKFFVALLPEFLLVLRITNLQIEVRYFIEEERLLLSQYEMGLL